MRFWLALLLTTIALAAPSGQTLSPSGERFTCQMPAGKIKEIKNPAAHQWLLLEKSKYALQVVSIAQGGSNSRVEFYLAKIVKSAKITENGRKPVQVKGFTGTEISGTLPSGKDKLAVRLRVLATPDHLYQLAAFIPEGGNAKVIDPFFKSFKLK